jgi:hypothetical protein
MKKMILLAGAFCFTAIASQAYAQSINNRNWKAYFADPINDSLTLHVHATPALSRTAREKLWFVLTVYFRLTHSL